MVLDIVIALYLVGCLIALGMAINDGSTVPVDRDCDYPKTVKALGTLVVMLTSWVYVGYRSN